MEDNKALVIREDKLLAQIKGKAGDKFEKAMDELENARTELASHISLKQETEETLKLFITQKEESKKLHMGEMKKLKDELAEVRKELAKVQEDKNASVQQITNFPMNTRKY